MIIPAKYVFFVGPISFSGPFCQANILVQVKRKFLQDRVCSRKHRFWEAKWVWINFQLDGTLVAPTENKAWGKGLLQWLEFTKLRGITIQGQGTIDGRGSVWWEDYPFDEPIDDETQLLIPLNSTVERSPPMPVRNELGAKMPSIKPTALRFYGSFNVTVTGITIRNSPQFHLKFDNCMGVLVHDMSVSSPGNSPNTDGIHLQNSKDVLIHSTDLACGTLHFFSLSIFFPFQLW